MPQKQYTVYQDHPHFRCSLHNYSRSDSRKDHGNHGSDVSAHLAYISGLTLTSSFDGKTKEPKGDIDRVIGVGVFGFGDVDSQVGNKELLQEIADRIDEVDTRKNSRLMRQFTLSIPRGLSRKEAGRLSARVSKKLSKRYKTCVISALHWCPKNPHVHINLPTRELASDGKSFGKKLRVLDAYKTGKKELVSIREICADEVNLAKEKSKGLDVDCRPVSASKSPQKFTSKVPERKTYKKTKPSRAATINRTCDTLIQAQLHHEFLLEQFEEKRKILEAEKKVEDEKKKVEFEKQEAERRRAWKASLPIKRAKRGMQFLRMAKTRPLSAAVLVTVASLERAKQRKERLQRLEKVRQIDLSKYKTRRRSL